MGIIDDILGAGQNALSAVEGGFSALENVFDKLTSQDTWMRVFFVAFGALLLFGALRYGHH